MAAAEKHEWDINVEKNKRGARKEVVRAGNGWRDPYRENRKSDQHSEYRAEIMAFPPGAPGKTKRARDDEQKEDMPEDRQRPHLTDMQPKGPGHANREMREKKAGDKERGDHPHDA